MPAPNSNSRIGSSNEVLSCASGQRSGWWDNVLTLCRARRIHSRADRGFVDAVIQPRETRKKLIQALAITLTCGATKQHFDQTLAVHPTGAEELVLLREPS